MSPADIVHDGSHAPDMPTSRRVLHRERRPELESEVEGVFVYRYHRCKDAGRLAAETGDPDIDLLCFPVGLVGRGMPLDVAFDVPAAGGCGACNADIRLWCIWTGPVHFFL